jgi:uncharacterized protein (TIGR03435 family)
VPSCTDWARPPRGEHFDIDARSAGDAAPSTAQLRLMLQRMLAERFQLKLHREMRPIPIYALVVANPAKIKEITKEQFDAQRRYARMPEQMPETMMIQMPLLAGTLQLRMDRPVLDETKFGILRDCYTGLDATGPDTDGGFSRDAGGGVFGPGKPGWSETPGAEGTV